MTGVTNAGGRGVWLKGRALDCVLLTRAALVQRARELLRPTISRTTVDEYGEHSLRPVAIVADAAVGDSWWYVLAWRHRAPPQAAGPAPSDVFEYTLTGIEYSSLGMRLLTPEEVRHMVDGASVWPNGAAVTVLLRSEERGPL